MSTPCPSCGYCPTCHRPGYQTNGYWPFQSPYTSPYYYVPTPTYITYPAPTITTSGGTTSYGNTNYTP